jgi:choline dehydrogenase-like flavoprotein
VRGAELSPGATAISANELEAAVRELATTGHHPVGTCRMGLATDPGAVVDAELRVLGLEGIRVCDASVFPTQISGNPQATVVACAEKAADLLLGRQPLPAANLDIASSG